MSDVEDTERSASVVAADDRPIRVLHVDDDSSLLEIASTWLERESDRLQVLTETDAADALDRLGREDVDCVLSDYDMPGMDGLAFLEAVRADHPDLPFVLFTGKGSEEIASDAISAGVTDYLQKEVGTDQYAVLANRIERAVDERRTSAALAESERVLSTLMSNVPGMVYRCRNEEGWPMEFVSDGALDVVGYTAEQLVAGDVSYGGDVIHPADRENVRRAVEGALDEGVPFRLEYRVRTRQGSTRWVWEQGRSVDAGGDDLLLEGVVIDITDRKEQEQALQTERDRLSALFENASAAVVSYEFEDDVPIIREVNPAFEETFGFEPGEVIGEDIDEVLVPPEKREEARRISDEARDGERLENEVTRLTADGLREFSVRSIPLRPGESGEEGWVIYTDITDRKEREAQLRKTERRYRRVVEQNLFGIYILQGGEIEYANPRAAEIFGYTPGEMMDGMTAFDVVAESEHDLLRENLRRREDGEIEDLRYELTGVHRDGSTFDFEVHSGRIEYDGEPAVLGALVDITDRKERERELERYETMAETVGDGVYVLDEDLGFRTVNEGLVELTGYDRETLLGSDATILLDAENTEMAIAAREELQTADTDVMTQRLDIETADGETVPCEIRFSLLTDEDGQFRGTAGVVRDVSDRVERERALARQNERLEEFASVLSHDLRNPLEVARSSLDLYHETGDESYYQTAADAHDRMTALIDDVLDLARQGRAVDEPGLVDLGAVATAAWDAVETEDATLTVATDGEIVADEERLRALFENLFANALEHGSTDGDGARVRVEAVADGFLVADDGPGIPGDERDSVFEPGYSTSEDGIGFGLYIVSQVAEAHDWSIAVTDSPAGGAQFVFRGVDCRPD